MCSHNRGDWIKEMGFWLCADCFEKRDGPVVKYGLSSRVSGSDALREPQIIIWQSAIAAADGTSLNDFLRVMVRRFYQKTRPKIDKDSAYDAAISALQDLCGLGDAYGDPAYDWSPDGARELADDEMMHWDQAESDRN